MSQNDNLLSILKVLHTYRKYIIWPCIITAVLSVGISLLLPNYYKSSTSFYAGSPDLSKPAPIGLLSSDRDVYGEDEDIDRLLTIANSNAVRDYLVKKYDLFTHYDIDSSTQKGRTKIQKRFKKLYTTTKTKYEAIELAIEDEDPVLSMDMVNDAVGKINQISQDLIKGSQKQLLSNYTQSIKDKEKTIAILSDSISSSMAKYGVFNTKSQGQVLAELKSSTQALLADQKARFSIFKNKASFRDSLPLLEARIAGQTQKLRSINEQISMFNQGLSTIIKLEVEQRESGEQLAIDKQRQEQLKATFNTPFRGLHVIEYAQLPEEKSRPKRSLIVIGAVLLCFIICLLSILLYDAMSQLNWKEITQDS